MGAEEGETGRSRRAGCGFAGRVWRPNYLAGAAVVPTYSQCQGS
jgi:hypothetical protein